MQTDAEQKAAEGIDDLGFRFISAFDGNVYKLYPGLEAIPNKWWLKLWEMYVTSFNIQDSILEQRVYSLEQFLEALIDPDYKKILVLQNEDPVGLMLGTHNLEKLRVNCINPDFLRRKYPEEAARNSIYYVTVIFFAPEIRSFGFFSWFLSLTLRLVASWCDVFVSDVCAPRLSLRNIIIDLAQELDLAEGPGEIIGTQTFFSIFSKHGPRKEFAG
jgi:hypothetical protein